MNNLENFKEAIQLHKNKNEALKNIVLSIEESKETKIKELKQLANNKFQATQWYYDREMRTTKIGKTIKPVPNSIVYTDELTYIAVDRIEAEINALNEVQEVLNYKITL